jgi:hypothetical protein
LSSFATVTKNHLKPRVQTPLGHCEPIASCHSEPLTHHSDPDLSGAESHGAQDRLREATSLPFPPLPRLLPLTSRGRNDMMGTPIHRPHHYSRNNHNHLIFTPSSATLKLTEMSICISDAYSPWRTLHFYLSSSDTFTSDTAKNARIP